MRILLSCLQGRNDHRLPPYGFWRNYFVQGLREAGHEVLEVPGVDWAAGLTDQGRVEQSAWRAKTWETVVDFAARSAKDRPIDLFLGYLFPRQVDTSAIALLQTRGIACVNFFCDNVREFRSLPAEYRPFALHWVPEFEALHLYNAAGLPHVHLPMPCWIPAELRHVRSVETGPPVFVGSADALRRDLLARAITNGGHFSIRGSGWHDDDVPGDVQEAPRSCVRLLRNQISAVTNSGIRALAIKVANRLRPLRSRTIPGERIHPSPIGTETYCRVVREAAVTIGISRVPTPFALDRKPRAYSRLRDIEAPMLGACYLTEWTEGLGHLYEPGVEVETYRTAEELSGKLRELMANPARRAALRQAGQHRALAEHTVARSIDRIARHLT
jgi:hypothetical protein